MNAITPEGKKLNPAYRARYRVIVTDASGNVQLVTKEYARESAALERAERETDRQCIPALFATLLEYED